MALIAIQSPSTMLSHWAQNWILHFQSIYTLGLWVKSSIYLSDLTLHTEQAEYGRVLYKREREREEIADQVFFQCEMWNEIDNLLFFEFLRQFWSHRMFLSKMSVILHWFSAAMQWSSVLYAPICHRLSDLTLFLFNSVALIVRVTPSSEGSKAHEIVLPVWNILKVAAWIAMQKAKQKHHIWQSALPICIQLQGCCTWSMEL